MINPSIVQQNGLTVNKCIQYPGEFVITKSAGYHAGFNMGFNCAEAVNFALSNWIDFAKIASYCKCNKDSVKIDLKSFVENLKNYEEKEFLKTKTKRGEVNVDKNDIKSDNNYIENDINENSVEINLAKTSKKNKDIKKKDVENWLCCDYCNKWRKIPKSKNFNIILSKKM